MLAAHIHFINMTTLHLHALPIWLNMPLPLQFEKNNDPAPRFAISWYAIVCMKVLSLKCQYWQREDARMYSEQIKHSFLFVPI